VFWWMKRSGFLQNTGGRERGRGLLAEGHYAATGGCSQDAEASDRRKDFAISSYHLS
jgi:hypothetical protein